MHVRRGRVARLTCIHHHDPAPGTGQHQRGGKTRRATADDKDVAFAHDAKAAGLSSDHQRLLPFPGKPRCITSVENASSIAAALELVAPRLRRIRAQRGATLADVSERTGISKSTLSRLETGQRRPSLELLLPLAQVYGVPLDDLVGAPDVGDPRIRLKPRRVHGRTVLPLAGKPGGVQAWKILIPATQSSPTLRVHDGSEWLYVLAGRMRLILGAQDLLLGEGEVVEFDTAVPHWFGSDGKQSAEVLSVFGRPGERMHVHSASRKDPM